MALSTTPVAGSRTRIAWPLLFEAALVAAAIAVLLPLFDRVRVARFRPRQPRRRRNARPAGAAGRRTAGSVCRYGALGEGVRDRLCARAPWLFTGDSLTETPDRMPSALAIANAAARQAFVGPLQEANGRVADLRLRQREGVGDLLALGNAIESVRADIEPYVERYGIDTRDGIGPTPLACAFEQVDASLVYGGARSTTRDSARANALLLLGAALDGHPSTAALADAATLPARPTAPGTACAAYSLPDALAAAASLVADARSAPIAVAKNDAMRALLRTAGWQWAAWSVAGLVLLNLSRRPGFAAAGVALALATWALAAWIGRVPWPLGVGQTFVLARTSESPFAAPAPFVVAMLAAALAVLVMTPRLRRARASMPQKPASPIGYPGLVLASGVGWLLLLDLSANGHFANRYLALYHQGHLWLAMTMCAVAR